MPTPQSVVAKLHNQNSYEEGAAADGALDPGQGCVIYEEDGEKHVRAAEADEQTARVVREQRNPPRAVGDAGASPLEAGYDEGNHVETVGFNRYDQARVRISYEADGEGGDVPIEDAELGWDGDGNLTTDTSNPVARGRVDLSDEFDDIDMAVVEFY